MKTKRPEIKSHPYDIVLFLLVGLILVGITIVMLTKNSRPHTSLHTEQARNYELRSEQMHMNMFYPSDMKIEQSDNSIMLKNTKGSVDINRIATSFNTAEDHFKYLAEKNHFEGYKTTKISIHSYDAILAEFGNQSQNERAYYIYVDHWIYSFRADNSSLFTTLDSIVDSFRYQPENP